MKRQVLAEVLIGYIFQLSPIVGIARIGIVHNGINPAKPLKGGGYKRGNGCRIGYIQLHGMRTSGILFRQLAYKLCGSGLIDVCDYSDSPVLNNILYKNTPEQTGTTSHHDNSFVKHHF
jgi:hypothetical protein